MRACNAMKHATIVSCYDNQTCHPHPHYGDPCMKYAEGSVRPISMYHPKKICHTWAMIVGVGEEIMVVMLCSGAVLLMVHGRRVTWCYAVDRSTLASSYRIALAAALERDTRKGGTLACASMMCAMKSCSSSSGARAGERAGARGQGSAGCARELLVWFGTARKRARVRLCLCSASLFVFCVLFVFCLYGRGERRREGGARILRHLRR